MSMLSQNSTSVAIGWQVFAIARADMSLKGAAAQLGTVGLVQSMPIAFLSLHAGVIADRHDRRFIVGICLAIQTGLVGTLALLGATGRISLADIFCECRSTGCRAGVLSTCNQRARPQLRS